MSFKDDNKLNIVLLPDDIIFVLSNKFQDNIHLGFLC